jgi:hypothetical protein
MVMQKCLINIIGHTHQAAHYHMLHKLGASSCTQQLEALILMVF